MMLEVSHEQLENLSVEMLLTELTRALQIKGPSGRAIAVAYNSDHMFTNCPWYCEVESYATSQPRARGATMKAAIISVLTQVNNSLAPDSRQYCPACKLPPHTCETHKNFWVAKK